MKRLRKSKAWLHGLCVGLFAECGVAPPLAGDREFRAFDATHVKEPGPTGSLWRVHYSVRLPSLACDFLRLTPTKGEGHGESFVRFPVRAGDLILADRSYATGQGVRHVAAGGGSVIVRVNSQRMVFANAQGESFNLVEAVTSITRPGAATAWSVKLRTDDDWVAGRLCAVRKSATAIALAHKKLQRNASKKQHKLHPDTLTCAEYVMVFTTFPECDFDADAILACYRLRWQVELTFKRFKSLAALSHLPKHDEDSAQAWLYGKLFMALLAEKLMRHASAISPWGYDLRSRELA